MITLTRTIPPRPARTVTLRLAWIKNPFLTYTKRFQEIRSHSRDKMDKCHWCKVPFQYGDIMVLGSEGKSGHKNQVYCQDCIEGGEYD